MNEYMVDWGIYIEATDPLDAARQVKAMLQDPGNGCWNFGVSDVDGEQIMSIDLDDDNDPFIWNARTP